MPPFLIKKKSLKSDTAFFCHLTVKSDTETDYILKNLHILLQQQSI